MMNVDSSRHKNDMVPFKSWECISLQLGNRDIDLVIPNQNDMDDLIAVVVKNMNTVDGNQGSAQVIEKQINKLKKKHNEQHHRHDYDDDIELNLMSDKERFQLIKTTCFKYKIMRLRGKISYHAFCKNQTIPELIMTQVL